MDHVVIALLPLLAWAVLIGATALSITWGVVIGYHWFRYAMDTKLSILTVTLYSVVATLLLSGLLASAIAMSSHV